MTSNVSEQPSLRLLPDQRQATDPSQLDVSSVNVSATLCAGKLAGLALRSVNGLRQTVGKYMPAVGAPLNNIATVVNELQDRIKKPAEPLRQSSDKVRLDLTVSTSLIQERTQEVNAFLEQYVSKAKQDAQMYSEIYIGENPRITEAHELLAKLLFVVDRDVKFAERLNKQTGLEAQKAEINKAFDLALNETKKKVASYETFSAKFGVLPAATIKEALLPQIIASLLITSTGKLNLGIVKAVQKALFAKEPTDAQKEIVRVLEQLRKDKNLQTITESVSAPVKDNIAYSAVAASCGLGSTEEVTTVHARCAFLSALLAVPAALPEACGYATSIGKFVKELRLDKCAEDLKALVMGGSLARSIDRELVPFDLNLQEMEATFVDAEIQYDKKGKMGAMHLRDVPGLMSAAELMGIAPAQYEKMLTDALARINSNKTTLRRIVHELAEGKEKIAQVGLAALSVQSTNILLQAWQNTLSRIAEERPALIMRAHVLDAVQAAFYTLFPVKSDNVSELSAFSSQNIRNFMKALLVEIDHDILIEYDADRHRCVIKGVQNPEEFRDLVIKPQITFEKLKALFGNDKQAIFFASRLDSFVTSNEFLRQVVVNFDAKNAAIESGADLQSLQFTPWGANYGADPFDFVRTYLGQDFTPIHSVRAATPQELLQNLLDFAKTHDIAKSTDARYLLATPHSPFTLLSEEATFQRAIQSPNNASSYVADYVKAIETLGLQRVSAEERVQLISWVESTFIPPQLVSLYKEQVEAIAKDVSLKELHDKLIDIAVQCKKLSLEHDENLPEDFSQTVSERMLNFLLKHGLAEEKRAQIRDRAIHFAEVTGSGTEKMHMCFYPDVLNAGSIRLGLISASGSKLRDLRTERWITPQAWELFKVQSDM